MQNWRVELSRWARAQYTQLLYQLLWHADTFIRTTWSQLAEDWLGYHSTFGSLSKSARHQLSAKISRLKTSCKQERQYHKVTFFCIWGEVAKVEGGLFAVKITIHSIEVMQLWKEIKIKFTSAFLSKKFPPLIKGQVMTCVMREGEDGVPDTVAHVDVEHPESENRTLLRRVHCVVRT